MTSEEIEQVIAKQEALANIMSAALDVLAREGEVPEGAAGRDVAFRRCEMLTGTMQFILGAASTGLAGQLPAEYEIQRLRRIACDLADECCEHEDHTILDNGFAPNGRNRAHAVNARRAEDRKAIINMPGAAWQVDT